MLRRGAEARVPGPSWRATPLYEALTVWVMAAWPELPLERVDTMVRTAIAAAPQVRNGHWTSRRLSDVVRKAGPASGSSEVHRHLGSPVNLVSLDAMPFEVADDLHRPPVPAASLAEMWSATCVWRSVTTSTW